MLVIRSRHTSSTKWGLARRFLALQSITQDYAYLYLWDAVALGSSTKAAAARVDRLANVAAAFGLGVALATPCDRRCGVGLNVMHGRFGWSTRETRDATRRRGAIAFSNAAWSCVSRYLGVALPTSEQLSNFSVAWPELCGERRVGTVCLPPSGPAGSPCAASASPSRRADAARPLPSSLVALERVSNELADAFEEWHLSSLPRSETTLTLGGAMCLARSASELEEEEEEEDQSQHARPSFVRWERGKRGALSPAVKALRLALGNADDRFAGRTTTLLVLDEGLSDKALALELDLVLPLVLERTSGGARGEGHLSLIIAVRCDRSFMHLLKSISKAPLREWIGARAVLVRARCAQGGAHGLGAPNSGSTATTAGIPAVVDALHRTVGRVQAQRLVAWAPGHPEAQSTLLNFPPTAQWQHAYGVRAASIFQRELWSTSCGRQWQGMVCFVRSLET